MIYPNNEYDESEDADSFMKLLYILFKAEMTPEEMKYQLTENYGIIMTEELAEEVENMCNLSQGIRAEGIAKGLVKGRAEGVMSLMDNMNISMEKAMDYLNITKDI